MRLSDPRVGSESGGFGMVAPSSSPGPIAVGSRLCAGVLIFPGPCSNAAICDHPTSPVEFVQFGLFAEFASGTWNSHRYQSAMMTSTPSAVTAFLNACRSEPR
jgi:hypothetical protein